MQVFPSVLVLLGCLAGIQGLPAPINDDVEFVPSERRSTYGDQPVVDTGVIGSFGGPFSNPFGGLFDNIEGIMTRMRQQMETLLKRFPGIGTGNSTADFPDFPTGGGLLPPFGDIDLSKGNTTSVTKIIDGHKVVINETEYKKEDDFGGAFFKVRVIDVKPDSGELTTEKEAEEVTSKAPEVKDRETVEDSIENEIPKSREEAHFENLETFDDVDTFQPLSSNPQQYYGYQYPEWDDNSIDYEPTHFQPIDLSGDTYVNQILADAGAPTNPDAEVFEVQPQPVKPERFRRPR